MKGLESAYRNEPQNSKSKSVNIISVAEMQAEFARSDADQLGALPMERW
jgi:hypothetical protein